jgi:hypothetical protein
LSGRAIQDQAINQKIDRQNEQPYLWEKQVKPDGKEDIVQPDIILFHRKPSLRLVHLLDESSREKLQSTIPHKKKKGKKKIDFEKLRLQHFGFSCIMSPLYEEGMI